MSLILDALKKSEAERRRGMPPTLHAPFGVPRRARRTPWVAGVGAVLLVAGLTGSWMMLSRGRVDSGAAPGAQPLAGNGASTTDASAGGTPATATVDVAAGSTPAVSPPGSVASIATARSESAFGGVGDEGTGATVSGGGLPVPQRAMLYTPSASPGPSVAAAEPPPPVTPPEPPVVAAAPSPAEPAPSTPSEPKAEQPRFEPSVVASAAPAEVSSGKPEEVLPEMFQLPYATRKDLPKLELSMHVFSPERTERFIVLNGKRYTLESAAPGPELNLLDIVADGAVFEFRGQRFLLPRQSY